MTESRLSQRLARRRARRIARFHKRMEPDGEDQPALARIPLAGSLNMHGMRSLPGRGGERMGEQSIRSHQRTHGNQATIRLIGGATATRNGSGQSIQRLLMTSNQFINAVGIKPHRDVKVPGKTLKKQSTHYKAVLDALDDYHNAIRHIDLTDGSANRVFDDKLDTIIDCAKTYHSRETSPDPKMQAWLNRLINEATGEKRVLRQAARDIPDYVPYGTKWAALMGGGEAGGLTLPPGAQVEQTADPGVEAKFKKGTSIFSDAKLKSAAGTVKKGDLSMRHETSHPRVLFVETYTLDKSKKEEGTPVFGPSGYVDSRFVGSSKYSHKTKDTDTPIFPRPPCIEDINQQSIGDCFLLAALGGIVKANPDFIYRMIRDNRDGTVTVRLYDMTNQPPGPRYLQITKSVISHDRRSKGALWVPLVEKAYAALGVKYQSGVATKVSSSYLQLGMGGHSDQSYMILTGIVGADASNTKVEARSDVPSSKPWARTETIKYSFHQQVLSGDKAAPQRKSYLEQMYSYAVLNQDATLIGRWVAFLQKDGVIDALEQATRVEQFEATFKHHNLDQAVQVLMLAEVRKYYQGKRGTGQYAPSQLRYYQRMEQALSAGKYVALGSRTKVAKVEEGKGHSGGESQAKGLLGTHVYTVIAVRHDQTTGVRWLRVRNPWGDIGGGYGRVYQENTGEKAGTLSAKKGSQAEFDLELSDMTKRFRQVYFSG